MIRSSLTKLPEEENIWYESSNQEMFSKTVLRLYIDYTKLVQFDLTLKDIAELCFPDTQWHASPDWMGMIDLEIVANYMTTILSKIDTFLCGDPRISSVHADIEERAPGAPKCWTGTQGERPYGPRRPKVEFPYLGSWTQIKLSRSLLLALTL